RHFDAAQLLFPVQSDDGGAVWITQDNLSPHIDQFVDEEEATLKHLLVNEYRSARLRSNDKYNAEQVRGKARPGRVGDRQNRAVDERLDFVSFLRGNVYIIATELQFYPESTEDIGNNAEHVDAAVPDRDLRLRHRCKPYKASDFDHVGEEGVFGSP